MLPDPLDSDPESECRESDPDAAPWSPPLAPGAVILLLARGLASLASAPGARAFYRSRSRRHGRAQAGRGDRRVSVKTCQVDKWTSCMMGASWNPLNYDSSSIRLIQHIFTSYYCLSINFQWKPNLCVLCVQMGFYKIRISLFNCVSFNQKFSFTLLLSNCFLASNDQACEVLRMPIILGSSTDFRTNRKTTCWLTYHSLL